MAWTIEQQRAYHAEWRKKNREKLAAASRSFKERNREKFRAAWRKRSARRQEDPKYVRHQSKRSRAAFLKRRHGLTIEEYTAMLNAQGGVCAICQTSPDHILRVDHDHATGKIRGLLCRKCNTGIGLLGDNFEGVKKALAYLKPS